MIIDRYSIVELAKKKGRKNRIIREQLKRSQDYSADYVDYPSRVVEIRRPWDQVYLAGKG